MKICKHCGKNERIKKSSRCRECYRIYTQKLRDNNREELREKSRDYFLNNKEKFSKSSKAWSRRNAEKNKAHCKVYRAIKSGELLKESCFCGEVEVEAHHEDYSKPLDVIWLCNPHHKQRHIEMKRSKK